MTAPTPPGVSDCPYCGSSQPDLAELIGNARRDEPLKTACESCDKKLRVWWTVEHVVVGDEPEEEDDIAF